MFGRKQKQQAEAARVENLRSKIDFHYTVMEGLILARMNAAVEVLTNADPAVVAWNREENDRLTAEIDRHKAAIEELEKAILWSTFKSTDRTSAQHGTASTAQRSSSTP